MRHDMRRKKCRSGKARFRDRVGADYALAVIRRKDNPGRPYMEVRSYRCPLCGGWHLTHRAVRP